MQELGCGYMQHSSHSSVPGFGVSNETCGKKKHKQGTLYSYPRRSNFYLAMLLFMLFLSLLPTMWVIVQFSPSNCGPFRRRERMYTIVLETLNDVPNWMGSAISYVSTPVVFLPAVLLLFMIIYYLQAISSSAKDLNSRLKLQLRYERKEGRRKLFKMGAGAKKRVQNQRHEEEVRSDKYKNTEEKDLVRQQTETSKKNFRLSTASSVSSSTTDKGPSSYRGCRPKPSVRGKTKQAPSYDSPKRKHTESRTRQKVLHADVSSSCVSPKKNCCHSSCSTKGRIPPGFEHIKYSPYTLHQPNVMLGTSALYSTIPRCSFASVNGSNRTTFLLHPAQVPDVPCIIVPATMAKQPDEPENCGQGEKVVFAQYDPLTGTVGHVVQEEIPTGGETGQSTPDRCCESARPRRSSFGARKQSNISRATGKSDIQRHESSCDTNDVFTSDTESHRNSKTLAAYDGGKRSEMAKTDSSTEN